MTNPGARLKVTNRDCIYVGDLHRYMFRSLSGDSDENSIRNHQYREWLPRNRTDRCIEEVWSATGPESHPLQ